MVRIQVIKASRLAVGAAVILLLAVLVLIALRGTGSTAARAPAQQSSLQSSEEVVAVFAARASSLPLIPEKTREAGSNSGVRISVVTPSPSPEPQERPRVLIYHTHTYEAYRQVDDDPYQETESWRTADSAHSIVRVGEALSELLTAAGCEVTHDLTNHELPDLRTAYSRSLETLLSYTEPFDLYIDLHRDAYSEGMAQCAVVDGQEVAQLMMMVGRGDNYQDKPDFEENYAFAARVTADLNAQAEGLCREVLVRTGRYNQHVGTPSLLIEVGHNQNTLEQALAAMPRLADALYAELIAE